MANETDLVELRSLSLATLAFLAVYFGLLIFQSFTCHYELFQAKKNKKTDVPFVKYYNATNPNILAADRAVGNTMEQALIFLPLVWIAFYVTTATGVSPAGIATSAWIYVIARALYLPVWKISGSGSKGIRPIILVATMPAYSVLVYLAYRILSAVL